MPKKDKLDIAILQGHIEWHKPEANHAHFDKLAGSVRDADLIVLPEMWSTGFTMKARNFGQDWTASLALMKQWSRQSGSAVAGSVIVEEDGRYFNRLFFVSDGEVVDWYDKRHLFGFSGEDRSFTAGNKRIIVNYKSWKFCLNICYDLRFPVWSRNYEDYDVLLYSANWPATRIHAWNSLLEARAIENQCYVIGANCYGTDAWHNSYSGHSRVFDFAGRLISHPFEKAGVIRQSLDAEALSAFRQKFPFLRDRDQISFSGLS